MGTQGRHTYHEHAFSYSKVWSPCVWTFATYNTTVTFFMPLAWLRYFSDPCGYCHLDHKCLCVTQDTVDKPSALIPYKCSMNALGGTFLLRLKLLHCFLRRFVWIKCKTFCFSLWHFSREVFQYECSIWLRMYMYMYFVQHPHILFVVLV